MQDLWIDAPAFLIVMTALLGLAVGSFLNVVVHRLPRVVGNVGGRTLVSGADMHRSFVLSTFAAASVSISTAMGMCPTSWPSSE